MVRDVLAGSSFCGVGKSLAIGRQELGVKLRGGNGGLRGGRAI